MQREIAAQCGISRSYVSRIEKKALKKLEEAMGERS
jgi:RNA polymerase sporulation-specific sigma factor